MAMENNHLMNPALSLLVLRTSKMDEMLALYQAIGLAFTREQHGGGPVHHSCDLGGTVLEIYPGDAKGAVSTRLGFRVESVDSALQDLKGAGASIVKPL